MSRATMGLTVLRGVRSSWATDEKNWALRRSPCFSKALILVMSVQIAMRDSLDEPS